MKSWISMLILLFAVVGICVWDGIHTDKVFDNLVKTSDEIYSTLLYTEITEPEIQDKILKLNDYWTKEMDTLCISISRKDLQVVSDYLQYLCASIINKNQEDAITYSRILNYNIQGLDEATGITGMNLL